MNRKNQLESYIKKFEVPGVKFSLLEFEELIKELKKTLPKLPQEAPNWPEDEKNLAEKLLNDMIYKKTSVYKLYKYDWAAGKVLPNEEELKLLKRYLKDFHFIIEFFDKLKKERSPSLADDFEWVKNDAKKVKEELEELLENDKYRQQAEEILKKSKNNPPDSQTPPIDNNEVKKTAVLLSKINKLEEKLRQNPTAPVNQADQAQLSLLKAQLQELKNKQKEKKDPKKDNFPWPLIIGGGVVILILFIALLITLSKKNQRR